MKIPHLVQRRQTWYARKKIPTNLQPVFKKKEFVETLGTRDIEEAKRRLPLKLAEIEQRFEEARNPTAANSEQSQKINNLIETVKWLREEQQNGAWNHELEPDELMDLALETAGKIPKKDIPKVQRLYHLAIHPDDISLEGNVKEYIEDKKGTIRNSSLESKENKLSAFAEWIGKETMLHTIDKAEARKYVIEVINKLSIPNGQSLSASTKIGYINVLKAFFEWTTTRGLTDDNPFRRTEAIITKGKKAPKTDVRGWKESEVINILEAVKTKNDNQLAILTIIGMYTGARGNEIAELKVEDTTEWSFRIQGDVKNDNSLRSVPIHSVIKGLVDKLKETSTDGYLIPELLRGGRDNKRYHNIGKKFGYLKNKLGYKGRATVFHSYRHTVTTLLLNAGEPQERIAGVVGHTADMNFTLNTYSDGLTNTEAMKVIEKLEYGKEVSHLVAKLIESVSS